MHMLGMACRGCTLLNQCDRGASQIVAATAEVCEHCRCCALGDCDTGVPLVLAHPAVF